MIFEDMQGTPAFEQLKDELSGEVKLKNWGEGEWLDEPDKLEFEYMNIKCLMIRIHAPDGPKGDHLFGGYWCGYVKIPSEYYFSEEEIYDLDVHGGITYSELKENEHWIGFDCAHWDDIIPSIQHLMPALCSKLDKLKPEEKEFLTPTYKNFKYVRREVENLVKQLVALNKAT